MHIALDKKYNITKLEFSIFVYFIMFTKDLRIYFIFLPILLYIRYVHVNWSFFQA